MKDYPVLYIYIVIPTLFVSVTLQPDFLHDHSTALLPLYRLKIPHIPHTIVNICIAQSAVTNHKTSGNSSPSPSSVAEPPPLY